MALTRRLAKSVDALDFAPPTTHVYNPLVYARGPVERYLERFARRGVRALWLGMNPGPYGMAQTGVPFGEIAAVQGLDGDRRARGPAADRAPEAADHGFACARSEVSGRRLWGWAADAFPDADAFFERFFVWNFCPLVFMEESGKNRTPDKLLAEERDDLFEVCDASLREMVELIEPEMVIGVGKFAEGRAKLALEGMDLPIATVLHPSPASPIANRGWAPQAEKQLGARRARLTRRRPRQPAIIAPPSRRGRRRRRRRIHPPSAGTCGSRRRADSGARRSPA